MALADGLKSGADNRGSSLFSVEYAVEFRKKSEIRDPKTRHLHEGSHRRLWPSPGWNNAAFQRETRTGHQPRASPRIPASEFGILSVFGPRISDLTGPHSIQHCEEPMNITPLTHDCREQLRILGLDQDRAVDSKFFASTSTSRTRARYSR